MAAVSASNKYFYNTNKKSHFSELLSSDAPLHVLLGIWKFLGIEHICHSLKKLWQIKV